MSKDFCFSQCIIDLKFYSSYSNSVYIFESFIFKNKFKLVRNKSVIVLVQKVEEWGSY